jgi:hypothetical protein
MRLPSWTWRGYVALLAIPVAVLGIASLGWLVNDWLWKRGEIDRLNELADADSLRLVRLEDSLAVYHRRLRVAKGEKEILENVVEAAREELERAHLTARASYNLAIKWRNQFVGATTPVHAGANTELPIDLGDREARIQGRVVLHEFHVPAGVEVTAELAATIERLGLNLVIAEAPDGGLVTQVTTSSPNVELLELEGITDLRSTGAERKRPGFLSGIWKGFSVGALVGAIVGAAAAGS